MCTRLSTADVHNLMCTRHSTADVHDTMRIHELCISLYMRKEYGKNLIQWGHGVPILGSECPNMYFLFQFSHQGSEYTRETHTYALLDNNNDYLCVRFNKIWLAWCVWNYPNSEDVVIFPRMEIPDWCNHACNCDASVYIYSALAIYGGGGAKVVKEDLLGEIHVVDEKRDRRSEVGATNYD